MGPKGEILNSSQSMREPAGPTTKKSWLGDALQYLVSIFSKQQPSKFRGARKLFEPLAPLNKSSNAASPGTYQDKPELNAVSGVKSYLHLLELIHRELAPQLYLEIGVRNGTSLRLSRCASIGIDPEPALPSSFPEGLTICHKTSDAFFESDALRMIPGKIDLAFIDGMHQFEYVLRDFINVEGYSTPTSLVVVDDVFPNHPVQARRVRESRIWTGDVWKLLVCLRAFRTDLVLIPVNTSPAGSLLIAGLDPANQQLTEQYGAIVKQFVAENDDIPREEILKRHSAIDPDDHLIIELLRLLRSCREEGSDEALFRERLGALARRLIAAVPAAKPA
jgi:Methyltransferase domain